VTGRQPKTVPVSKFKATCLALLERVRRTGEPIIVTRRGVPLAQVVPPPVPEPGSAGAFGCMADTMQIVGDLVSPVSSPEDWSVLT